MATATCQKEKTGNSPPVHWGLILNRVHLSVCHSASSFLQLGSPHMMQWSAIFPNETVSEQQSALFVKKLLAVAISNITYLRAIFPEHAFGDRCLEDLNLKILRDDSTCPGACQVIKWVKGCFDALDKKYLKVLIIGLYQDPDDPNTVIESYTFKFSYTKEGGIDIYRNDKKISSAYTESETKKATIRLLRTVVVLTQTLQSLPDDVMMTMKLLYYEDVTPPDYEPPGFRSAETDQDFKFEEEPLNIKVGDVSTPFHTIKMRIKTSGEQFDLKESTIEEEHHIEKRTETDQQMEIGEETKDAEIYDFHDEQNMSAEPIKSKFKVNRNASSDAAIPSESPAVPGSNDKAVDTTGSQKSQLSETQEDMGVRCPCGCNEDDGLMILCAVCKFWQHGLCFLIMSEDEAPEIHICDMCCDENDPDKQSTDPYLCGLSSVALQATCMWRRALMAASEIDRLVAPNLAKRLGVEMSVAQGLINRLEREGFIQNPQKGKRLGKLVQKEKIMTEGIQKYLTKMSKKSKNRGENMETMEKENVIDENDAKKKTSVSDGQIENLTKMTDNMELSKKKKRKRKSALEKLNEENEIRHSPRIAKMESKKVEPQKSGNKVLSRKRVISKVDEDTEFQLADSQDLTYDSEPDKRRRKASVVARAIRV